MSGYDLPESGKYASYSEQSRRTDPEFASDQREKPHVNRYLGGLVPPHAAASETFHPRRLVDENVRVVERDRMVRQIEPEFRTRDYNQWPESPSFSVSRRVSRPQGMNTGSVVADQAFINNFSQSRLEPPLPQPRDGFPVLPYERPHQSFGGRQDDPRPYEHQLARSFAGLRPVEASSPIGYVQRPMQESQQPRFHEQHDFRGQGRPAIPAEGPHPIVQEQQGPSFGTEAPIHVRAGQSKRQVIVLE